MGFFKQECETADKREVEKKLIVVKEESNQLKRSNY